MALLLCYECGGKVSSAAANCPHCGAPVKKGSKDCENDTDRTIDPRKAKTGKINVSDEEWGKMRAEVERQKKLRKNKASYSNKNVVCPSCHNSNSATRIKKSKKIGSVLLFGVLAVGHVNKTFKCQKCGYTW
jgi:ribosomal protein S27AE